MRYQLVLQFPATKVSFDRLVEIEDRLIDGLDSEADVDGHDLGTDEGNIFIWTDDPRRTLADARSAMDPEDISELRAAFRSEDGNVFTILWPEGLKEFRVA
jgi:hypothetical protein